MKPIFVDIHIHTSDNPDNLDPNYPIETLVQKINEFTDNSDFLRACLKIKLENCLWIFFKIKKFINN